MKSTETRLQIVDQSATKNRLYRICGYTILSAIAAIAVYIFLPTSLRNALEPELDVVFWLEVIAIVAFGISWFVK